MWWKRRGAEGRHLETVPWKGGREEMGSGEPLTVFGEEKREEKTIGFWINDHSLQESISRRLYLERGDGN